MVRARGMRRAQGFLCPSEALGSHTCQGHCSELKVSGTLPTSPDKETPRCPLPLPPALHSSALGTLFLWAASIWLSPDLGICHRVSQAQALGTQLLTQPSWEGRGGCEELR